MDEYDRGMDPEVKRYFKKIINSFSYGLIWMLFIVTAGLFFGLGIIYNGIHWYNVLFYGLAIITFGFLIRYFYRTWK